MSYKLNKAYIRDFAERAAENICNEFFQNNQVVNGTQLVNLTEIRQVNFFLVKNMYLSWQEEGAALHNPYFNYSSPEVKQAFNKLMNILSKNIQIYRNDFEPFLAQSIKDATSFLISPQAYFEKLFDNFNGKIHVKSQLIPLRKYYRYHLPLVEKFFEELQEEGSKVKAKKALKILDKCITKYPALLSNIEEVIKDFDAFGSLNLEEALIHEEVVIEEEASLNENDFQLSNDNIEKENNTEGEAAISSNDKEEKNETSEFEFEDFSDEKEAFSSNENSKQVVEDQKQDVTDTPETLPNSWGEMEQYIKGQKGEEKAVETSITATEENITDSKEKIETGFVGDIESIGKAEDATFNDFLDKDKIEEEVSGVTKAIVPSDEDEQDENTQKTLLDKIQEQSIENDEKEEEKKPILFTTDEEDEAQDDDSTGYSDLVNKMQQGKEEKKLKGSIPLNLKLRYKKELFGDDQAEFESAIDIIDNCGDYHEAISILKEKYVSKYSWDFSGDATREFLSMVDNKF